jgi:hypothetical protein
MTGMIVLMKRWDEDEARVFPNGEVELTMNTKKTPVTFRSQLLAIRHLHLERGFDLADPRYWEEAES